MLTAVYENMDGRYGRWMTVTTIDDETLIRAQEIFDDYKNRGVILNDHFDDAVWRLSNQARRVGLMLSFEGEYQKTSMEWIGCSYPCYQDCVKAYITFNLGKLGILTLRSISEAFKVLAKQTIDDVVKMDKHINHMIELLQIIPGGNEERDYVIEVLEEKMERSSSNRQEGNQRKLADFQTYLKFNEVLNEFWLTANKKQKLFYFPLYFWWNLTAILPLRPMEFLLTPRDCLENVENILTIRRTKLKGGIEKVAYRIDGDYERKKYVISTKLADELRSYLKATDKMKQTEINTLFLQKPHFDYIGRRGHILNRYYSYVNLRTCMRYFIQEARPSADNMALDTINFGDTRHLAMANLIISGGSPVICKELAGHADIDIGSHYYSNISNLVECVTLQKFRENKSGSTEMVGAPKYMISLPEIRHRLAEGWCDAPNVEKGDISECLKAVNDNGHIGSCDYCMHYWPDDQGIRFNFLDVQTGKVAVDSDCQYLMSMINMVRKGHGYEEDIKAALLRLQHSSDHYSKCLWDKYMREEVISCQDQEN